VAKSLGADGTVNIGNYKEPAEIAKAVESVLGEMPAVTIECSGAEASIKAAILVVTIIQLEQFCLRFCVNIYIPLGYKIGRLCGIGRTWSTRNPASHGKCRCS